MGRSVCALTDSPYVLTLAAFASSLITVIKSPDGSLTHPVWYAMAHESMPIHGSLRMTSSLSWIFSARPVLNLVVAVVVVVVAVVVVGRVSAGAGLRVDGAPAKPLVVPLFPGRIGHDATKRVGWATKECAGHSHRRQE
jgi:hypothetical protein